MKKIIAVFCSIAICFSLFTFASASETSSVARGNYWDHMAMAYFSGGDAMGGAEGGWYNFLGKLSSNLSENVCPASEDHLHHGDTVRPVRGGSSATTYTMECKCDYCGELFQVKKTASDLSTAYSDYVETLPSDNINSQGLSDMRITGWHSSSTGYITLDSERSDIPYAVYLSSPKSYKVNFESGSFSVPSSGMYNIHFPTFVTDGTLVSPDFRLRLKTSSNGGETWGSSVFYKDGFSSENPVDISQSFSSQILYRLQIDNCFLTSTGPSGSVSYGGATDYVTLQGVQVYAPGSTSVDITTRPTSITGGNYGIVGDNNEIIKVEDNSTIVNETNNTYHNPATGTTVPITNWSYDYSDRSYKVTLESGDTATITYGDENISITETNTTSGDTVTNNYTIYYLVDAPETPVDPPAACTHNWTETGTTPATCTVPGSRILTCSLCSQSKTESIPALGHDWEVKQTVNTQYDETGQLIQQGYTVFECGTCHEQYKSEDGVLPPAVTPGTGTDIAAVDALKEKLQIAADALLGIFNKLPELFTGFTNFLSAVFPFVPTEFITIFELGLFLLIAAAALRKFLS